MVDEPVDFRWVVCVDVAHCASDFSSGESVATALTVALVGIYLLLSPQLGIAPAGDWWGLGWWIDGTLLLRECIT